MYRFTQLFPALLSLTLLFCACRRDSASPALPYRGGPNYAACTINGERFVPDPDSKTFSGSVTGIDGGIRCVPCQTTLCDYVSIRDSTTRCNLGYYLSIRAGGRYVAIYFDSTPHPGRNEIGQRIIAPYPTAVLPGAPYCSVDGRYLTGPTARGYVDFTYIDRDSNETMGTFAFTAKDLNGDSVVVENGAFYLKKWR
jgi:hypothetical protein